MKTRTWLGLLVAALVVSVGVNAWMGATAMAQRLAKPRIAPVAKESWTDEQKEILATREVNGTLYNVYTTVANHPDLARDWLVFGAHILRENTLPPRDRETLILRIGWLCKSEYEWAHHVPIGNEAGLTDDDIKRITEGPKAKGLSANDALLLAAVNQLHEDAFIQDDTWNALAKTYNTQQMMDLVFTVGQYNMVSMALNSFGVQIEPGFEGFPK